MGCPAPGALRQELRELTVQKDAVHWLSGGGLVYVQSGLGVARQSAACQCARVTGRIRLRVVDQVVAQ